MYNYGFIITALRYWPALSVSPYPPSHSLIHTDCSNDQTTVACSQTHDLTSITLVGCNAMYILVTGTAYCILKRTPYF